MRDVLLLLSTILYYLPECKNGCETDMGTNEYKTPIFNLPFLHRFLLTRPNRSTVK